MSEIRQIPVGLDPSVTGLAGEVGERVVAADGSAIWDKTGTGITDWETPGTGTGGGTPDDVSLTQVGGVWSVIPGYIEGLVAPTLPKAGANLTDANVTKNPASDAASVYTLPAATLSANRVLTLGVSGSPVTDSVVQIIRRDLTNKTYTVNDDAASPLIVFGASPASPQGATFTFDGTHYTLLNFFYVEA